MVRVGSASAAFVRVLVVLAGCSVLAGCGAPAADEVLPPEAEWAPAGAAPTPTDSGALANDTGAWSGVPHTQDDALVLALRGITVYAVRHAEKEDEGDDPGLTAAGVARAEALATLLAPVPLDGVFATDLLRTQLTVQPTADDHGLPVITDVDAEDDLAPLLLAAPRDSVFLHAGHTYTLPDFFEALGADPVPEVDGYGQLWIIRAAAGAHATVEETTYGLPEE